ncbi:hypothetical protein M1771_03715 [Spiroplasma citri]|uniref:Uncharacterized protein n=1 Tax=Spiroplasma citri TaxID=2133 RepID=A0AAX3T0I5_SPICI|nr:hypothetical protein [Spiroplasma citri]WFG97115.1 hypothetical protein M0C40_03705 [Spiroplasma citri]WFH01018.1 hypothetical protein M1771_03715 [Spiroplasma citri]
MMVISSNEKQKEANKQFGIKIEYKNINEDLKPNDYYQKIKIIKTRNWKKLQQSSCRINIANNDNTFFISFFPFIFE